MTSEEANGFTLPAKTAEALRPQIIAGSKYELF